MDKKIDIQSELDKIFGEEKVVGLSKVIRPLALQLNITFEAARDLIYKALDEKLLILNSHFRLEKQW